MQASGSPLMEIGTTNRTHLGDYAEALDAGAGLILIVHRSNFVISGYVTEPKATCSTCEPTSATTRTRRASGP